MWRYVLAFMHHITSKDIFLFRFDIRITSILSAVYWRLKAIIHLTLLSFATTFLSYCRIIRDLLLTIYSWEEYSVSLFYFSIVRRPYTEETYCIEERSFTASKFFLKDLCWLVERTSFFFVNHRIECTGFHIYKFFRMVIIVVIIENDYFLTWSARQKI